MKEGGVNMYAVHLKERGAFCTPSDPLKSGACILSPQKKEVYSDPSLNEEGVLRPPEGGSVFWPHEGRGCTP